MELLWQAVDSGIKTRKEIDVQYNEVDKEATLIYEPKTILHETQLVRYSYSNLVKFGLEAFKIDEISTIKLIVKVPFIDDYGNSYQEEAIEISINKDNFQKYNWDNLNYRPIHETIKKASDFHHIHFSIQKNLDVNELYLYL